MSKNKTLADAKSVKNDEFYTQYADSAEVKRLRDEADVIVTTPPFSLFREFVAWIVESAAGAVARDARPHRMGKAVYR